MIDTDTCRDWIISTIFRDNHTKMSSLLLQIGIPPTTGEEDVLTTLSPDLLSTFQMLCRQQSISNISSQYSNFSVCFCLKAESTVISGQFEKYLDHWWCWLDTGEHMLLKSAGLTIGSCDLETANTRDKDSLHMLSY